MKKLINDFKQFNKYALYSAKAELKTDVANSYFSWLWWLLDPLFFMLIYTFIVVVVYKTSEPAFPVFVLIGLNVWNFFSKVVSNSVKIVSANKGVVSKVYLPKYILILQKLYVNFFKMIISTALVAILLLLYKVQVSMNIIYLIPLAVVLLTLTFGCSIFLAHFGVFVEDLANVVNILLRLMFYLSGIFYSISSRIPSPFNTIMLRVNPVAYLIEEYRNVLLHNATPNLSLMIYWYFISIIIVLFSSKLMNKYENSYVKVI